MSKNEGCDGRQVLTRSQPGFLGDREAQALADSLHDVLRSQSESVDSLITLKDIHSLGIHRNIPYVRSVLAKYIGIDRNNDSDDNNLFQSLTTGAALPELAIEELEDKLKNSSDERIIYAIGYLMMSDEQIGLVAQTVKIGEEVKTIFLDPLYDSRHKF